MQTAPAIDHSSEPELSASHRVGAGVWLLPVFGALTLWATVTHQPSPTTDFASWARFVTTDEFLAKHLVGSIFGLAINTVGVASLTWVVLAAGRHVSAAIWGFTLTVVGS